MLIVMLESKLCTAMEQVCTICTFSEQGATTRVLPEQHRQILTEKLNAAYGKTIKTSNRLKQERFEERVALILKCCQEEDLV